MELGTAQTLPALRTTTVVTKPNEVTTQGMGAPPINPNNAVNMNFGNGGGINFNFGPTTDALANSAYSFLNTTFAGNNAFVSNAISGAQNFYSGLVSPATRAASNQIEQNNRLLPTLYNSLLDTNNRAMTISENMTYASIQSQQYIANNAVREQSRMARRSGKPKGFCFITTACCEYAGLKDDCYILQTLRKFRDEYMAPNPELKPLIDEYYKIAPEIVAKIKARNNSENIFAWLKTEYIDKAIQEIEACDFEAALETYRAMVLFAKGYAQ